MASVIVSEGVANAFNTAERYKGKISKFEAHNLIGASAYKAWYEFAKSKGFTNAKTINEYIANDHDGLYTYVFLVCEK